MEPEDGRMACPPIQEKIIVVEMIYNLKFAKIFHIVKLFLHPRDFLFELSQVFPKCFPDKLFLKVVYRHVTGEKLHIHNPRNFNEKIQWLKLYDRDPEYTKLVDKYEVKDYIRKTIGDEYVIPTLAVYNKAEEIDFDALPIQFVLKCTHDSGGVVICNDKSKLDKQNAIKLLGDGLKKNFYYQNREWPYKNVIPRIIAEQYMVDESGEELKDYKFFCFYGEPKIIQVDYDRFVDHKRNLYDIEWNRLPFTLQFPTNWNYEIAKPQSLGEMIEVARKLSKGIPHVRVDLYHINGKVYFGEMTFYHGSGYEKFTPGDWNNTLGEWIKI